MKKMIFSAAAFAVVAVSTAVVAPTTSEAIPAFARQTGAACLSCHFQTMPTLAPMGRAFKQGAFTDVGEQALIEDDALSIPSVMNMTLVFRPQFKSVTSAGVTTKTTAMTADQVILIGGRVGTNSGAFVEYDGTFANVQLFNSFEVAGINAGFSLYNSGFGESFGMEVSSVYGQHSGAMGAGGLTANDALSRDNMGQAGGVALYANNDMITASLSFVTLGGALDGATGNGWKLAPSLRVFTTQEVGSFELGLGGNLTSGQTGNSTTVAALGLAAGTTVKMKKWGLDAQLQGELGDMQVGAYFDYAKAAAPGAAEYNPFTAGFGQTDGYSARVSIKPLHNVILMAGYGRLRTDAPIGTQTTTAAVNGTQDPVTGVFTAGTAAVTNAAATVVKKTQFQVGAEYELYQNFVVALTYNSTKVTDSTAGTSATTKTTKLDIEALL